MTRKEAMSILRRGLMAHTKRKGMACDAEKWITTKKGERGGGGKKFLIDTESGVILKGGPKRMRGKPLSRAFESKGQRKERYKANRKEAKAEFNKTLNEVEKSGVLHSSKVTSLRKLGVTKKRLEYAKQLLKDNLREKHRQAGLKGAVTKKAKQQTLFDL